MIIVSQDKKEATEGLELRIECIVEEKGEFPYSQRIPCGYVIVEKKFSTNLGTYASLERAKEVLQEIIRKSQNFRNDMCYIVYEMPEK